MATSKNLIRNIVIGLIAVAAVVAVGLRLASNKKKIADQNQVVDRSGIAVPVVVSKVSVGDAQAKFTLPAVLEAENEVNVTLASPGKLKSLNIQLGTHVSKGQVLGSVDNSLKELNLATTELLIQKLETDYKRTKELFEGNAATEVDLSNVKYNLENAKMQAALIKQQIADGLVVAPCNGVITAKVMDEGEYVNPGMVIATVLDVNRLKAMVTVSENDVYRLSQAMAVVVRADVFPTQPFPGSVRFISPKGDENHNYKVEVSLENKAGSPLKAGTYVHVDFDIQQATKALQIPKNSLVEGMKNPYVYTIVNKKSQARKIVLGRELGENIEVLEGLKEGEEVIVSGQINLSEGTLVEVVSNK